jgi:hypothetical protein
VADTVALGPGFSTSTSSFCCQDHSTVYKKVQPLLLRRQWPFPTDCIFKILVTTEWASCYLECHVLIDAIFVIEYISHEKLT